MMGDSPQLCDMLSKVYFSSTFGACPVCTVVMRTFGGKMKCFHEGERCNDPIPNIDDVDESLEAKEYKKECARVLDIQSRRKGAGTHV